MRLASGPGAGNAGPQYVFRPKTAQLAGVLWGLVTILWAAFEAKRGASALILQLPLMATVGIVVTAVFIRPCVVIDDSGLTVRNVLRDIRLPFGAVTDVTTTFCLAVTDRQRRTYKAWAAPAAGRVMSRGLADPGPFHARPSMPVDLPVDTSRSDAESVARVVRQFQSRFTLQAPAVDDAGAVEINWAIVVLAPLAVSLVLALAASFLR